MLDQLDQIEIERAIAKAIQNGEVTPLVTSRTF